MLERAKSSILPNGNFRDFFLWRGGEFCVFKTGIPGGPVTGTSSQRSHFNLFASSSYRQYFNV